MRYITAVLRPVEQIHPTIPALTKTAEITPVAIHQTHLLDDGTEVTLVEVRGELDRLHAVLSEHPSLRDYTIAGDRTGMVYCHSEPHDLARGLLRLRDEYEVIVQMPLRFTGDGGLRGTLIGDDETFQRAVDNLPDDLHLEVEGIGDYQPDMGHLFSTLTGRQQEVLETAIREGYYEDPRQVSQKEIAEKLDVSPATVSQLLRRIEANVFSEFVIDEDAFDDSA